jgi:hypothetical protein
MPKLTLIRGAFLGTFFAYCQLKSLYFFMTAIMPTNIRNIIYVNNQQFEQTQRTDFQLKRNAKYLLVFNNIRDFLTNLAAVVTG